MRVLVTGAAGFIGQYVVKALQLDGHSVLGIDLVRLEMGKADLPTDIPSPGRLLPLSWATPVDITQPIPSFGKLDAVIHLAALSHPRQCDENPGKAFAVNVAGTHNVLKMALESGAKKVVFSSSAHVYGISPRYLPTPESHPLWLQNTYTTTKILGEQLCHLFYENHGLSYTTLRLFNAYGDGQALGYYIPDMLAKAKTGHINLLGANTTKDWIHVTDVAEAFVRAMGTSYVGAVNIGTGVETSLGSILETIADGHGITFSTAPADNATRMCADNQRAKRVLGWEPRVNLREGLDAILSGTKSPQPVLP